MEFRKFDAIVIGGGAAGLYTALSLSDSLGEHPTTQEQDWKIALITKDNLTISASDWAQGGIAAVIDRNDSINLHIEDTLRAGAGLCEREAVEVLVSKAKPQIHKLLEFGVDFDRLQDKSLALTLEAAHSRRRVLHAADATGRELVSTLARRVVDRPNIQVLEGVLVLDLLLEKSPEGDRCVGVSCVELKQDPDKLIGLLAPVTVLATGGGAQVFSQNTNPPASTGDGVAIAWRAGAKVRDLEFVQFHPTALAIEGAPRFLISEAVRGEGAHLIDHNGDRFAFEYHPQGELAPRDVVSRAIFQHLQKTGEPTVFLDLSPIDRDHIAYRFPNIIKICQKWHIDLFSQPIPVTPAAHYCMGGIVTDTWGASSITGLYAVGESSSTGVHGANRLASNSLLECFVFGVRLAEKVAQDLIQRKSEQISDPQIDFTIDALKFPDINTNAASQERIATIRQELRELTWRSAGICRNAEAMETAIDQIQNLQQEISTLRSKTRLWAETHNLIDFAYLLVKSALFRTESRGAHFRLDYPDTESTWQLHTVIHGQEIFTQ
ncbi:L-aspartate oxidase [Pseudanabaena yagii]|uniref:L-aspartate oxidase n=1 Tax=Pseudanabaena yagii GIHE-NHR1 TaxID=2722753 RepID=A0ABX1LNC1_9CYAN|nr:L-aspartate oxidase [Pseudanabaena yagii]NMF57618.1 L-aspartate oxidase [Pseudanabaena yagii GIHE-NHR1]